MLDVKVFCECFKFDVMNWSVLIEWLVFERGDMIECKRFRFVVVVWFFVSLIDIFKVEKGDDS